MVFRVRLSRRTVVSAVAVTVIAVGVGTAIAGDATGKHRVSAARPARTPERPVPVAAPGWRMVPYAPLRCPAWPSGAHDDARFSDVAATGASDAWAAGSCGPAGQEDADASVDQAGVIEHWDGRRWIQVNVPPAAAHGISNYDSVQALSAHDVWFGGQGGLDDDAAVIHWDGRQWTRPSQGLPKGAIMTLSATSAPGRAGSPNVWGQVDGGSDWPVRLYHWDRGQWSEVHAPRGWNLPISEARFSAGSNADVWSQLSTGTDDKPATGPDRMARYDGHRWTFLPRPVQQGYTGLPQVVVIDRRTWIIMSTDNGLDTAYRIAAASWEDGHWTRPSAASKLDPDESISDVSGDGRGGLWILTDASEQGTLRHWDGHRWTTVRLPHPLHDQTVSLSALSLVPGTSTVWTTGYFGPNAIDDGLPVVEATGPPPP
jgi:hypothetical protein